MAVIEALGHCGAMRIKVAEGPRQLMSCSCSICRHQGTLWAYYHPTRSLARSIERENLRVAMALSELTDDEAILAAIREYDALGQRAFLAKYGYSPARRYQLIHNGKRISRAAACASLTMVSALAALVGLTSTATRAYLASRRATFIRCTLSPARWLQMIESRTSLSAWALMAPAQA
jgi:hypothetical protein